MRTSLVGGAGSSGNQTVILEPCSWIRGGENGSGFGLARQTGIPRSSGGPPGAIEDAFMEDVVWRASAESCDPLLTPSDVASHNVGAKCTSRIGSRPSGEADRY
jgi:hypothetical protein